VLLAQLRGVMPAAVRVVRTLLVAAIVPTFAESLFAVEKNELDSDLRFLLQAAEDASDFQQRCHRGSRIVRAEKTHVFVELRIVVAGDQNRLLSFAGDFG